MKKKRLVRAACMAAYLSLSLIGSHADAEPIRWHGQRVHLQVEGKDLKDVLRDFTAGQNVPATIAGDVHGTVTGQFDMSPQRFLDTLASTFGFVWFYDGNVLSISDANSVTRQIVKLDHASTDDLKTALVQLRITNPRFPITYDSTQGTALVSGPQPYVQMVAEIAHRLDDRAGERLGSSIRVFSLHHAWADDHNVQIDGKTVTVPGVATVLSRMYHPEGGHDSLNGSAGLDGGGGRPAQAPAMQRMRPMRDVAGGTVGGGYEGGGLNPPLPQSMNGATAPASGLAGLLGGMSAGGPPSTMPRFENMTLSSNDNSGGTGTTDSNAIVGSKSLPVIEPDPRTNSVLIRDVPQRLSQYQDLIDRLDVKPKLIEIEAHIIEIDDGALKQIGVDWRAHNSHVDFQTGNGTTQQNGYNGNINPTFGTQTLQDGTTIINTSPIGASLTAVLGNAGRYLMARVNALQQSNLAKIDASPKVATLDNVEAVMDHKTQFFVRVSGYTAADLYSVEAGVSLRVLPMVVEENGQQQIKMKVNIEDGTVTNQQVDNIPIITRSTINTESFVGQGESLLIAGYRVDSSTNGETGIPLLSKIPVLGALFRYRSNERSHMERLFLLSPRILEY
ncbi:type III secretion system outer membrane ring subunit SctC [Trinickia sp. LjRoot230]|uniref:type III secretion system outer membrane ring subunit SctC n=1 Tax=Trinickia sp. LjRoot230 TaxID=3342288 RepID=UPI003ED0CFD3